MWCRVQILHHRERAPGDGSWATRAEQHRKTSLFVVVLHWVVLQHAIKWSCPCLLPTGPFCIRSLLGNGDFLSISTPLSHVSRIIGARTSLDTLIHLLWYCQARLLCPASVTARSGPWLTVGEGEGLNCTLIVKMLRIQLPCSNRLLSFSTCPTPGQNSFRQFVLGSSFGGKRAWPCLLWADSIGCSWAEHQNNPAGVLNTLHTLGKWAPAALQVGRSCSQPKCCEGGNELSKSSGLLAEVPTTCYSFRHPRSALGAMHRLDTNVFTVTKVPFPR